MIATEHRTDQHNELHSCGRPLDRIVLLRYILGFRNRGHGELLSSGSTNEIRWITRFDQSNARVVYRLEPPTLRPLFTDDRCDALRSAGKIFVPEHYGPIEAIPVLCAWTRGRRHPGHFLHTYEVGEIAQLLTGSILSRPVPFIKHGSRLVHTRFRSQNSKSRGWIFILVLV